MHAGRDTAQRRQMAKTFVRPDSSADVLIVSLAIGDNPGTYRITVARSSSLRSRQEEAECDLHQRSTAAARPLGFPSAKYTILQADVGFLLKRCEVCAHLPVKHAKSVTQRNTRAIPEGSHKAVIETRGTILPDSDRRGRRPV
jgi:hypothetical protein